MPLNIILKPSITEKSFKLAKKNQFTFFVKKSATKKAIAHAIEELFKVNVIKVRTVKKAEKTKRSSKNKIIKKTSNQKKAIITLKKGQTIEYFKLPDEKKVTKKNHTSENHTNKALKTKSKSNIVGKLKQITNRKKPE